MGGRRVREKVKGGVKGLSSRAELRDKVRGEYRFSSLMKQKKKAKIALSFASPEKELFFLYL
jgi:hypothetical protein